MRATLTPLKTLPLEIAKAISRTESREFFEFLGVGISGTLVLEIRRISQGISQGRISGPVEFPKQKFPGQSPCPQDVL